MKEDYVAQYLTKPDRVHHTGLYGAKSKKILSYLFHISTDLDYRYNYELDQMYDVIGKRIVGALRYLSTYDADDGEILLVTACDSWDFSSSVWKDHVDQGNRRKWLLNIIKGMAKIDLIPGCTLLNAQTTFCAGWNTTNEDPAFKKIGREYAMRSQRYGYGTQIKPLEGVTVKDAFMLCEALRVSPDKFKAKYGEAAYDEFVGQAADPIVVELRVAAKEQIAKLKDEYQATVEAIEAKRHEIVDAAYKKESAEKKAAEAELSEKIDELEKQLAAA